MRGETMNLINILFMQLTFVIVVLGALMNLLEKYLPTAIKQTFRYGKHAHKDGSDKLVERIELPKSWFSHFYVFAIFWSWVWFAMGVKVCLLGGQLPSWVISYLDFSCGNDRSAESNFYAILQFEFEY